ALVLDVLGAIAENRLGQTDAEVVDRSLEARKEVRLPYDTERGGVCPFRFQTEIARGNTDQVVIDVGGEKVVVEAAIGANRRRLQFRQVRGANVAGLGAANGNARKGWPRS